MVLTLTTLMLLQLSFELIAVQIPSLYRIEVNLYSSVHKWIHTACNSHVLVVIQVLIAPGLYYVVPLFILRCSEQLELYVQINTCNNLLCLSFIPHIGRAHNCNFHQMKMQGSACGMDVHPKCTIYVECTPYTMYVYPNQNITPRLDYPSLLFPSPLTESVHCYSFSFYIYPSIPLPILYLLQYTHFISLCCPY